MMCYTLKFSVVDRAKGRALNSYEKKMEVRVLQSHQSPFRVLTFLRHADTCSTVL